MENGHGPPSLLENTPAILSMSGLTKVSGVKPWRCPCAARREGTSVSCHLALLCGTSFQTLSPSALFLARFLLPLILSVMLTSTRLVLHNLMMQFFLSLFLSFFFSFFFFLSTSFYMFYNNKVEQFINVLYQYVMRSGLAIDHFTNEEKIDRHTITRREV